MSELRFVHAFCASHGRENKLSPSYIHAMRRLLYRPVQSPHAHRFVLEGAMLLLALFDEPFRGSRDLLSRRDPQSAFEDFREILGMERRDSVRFDVDQSRIDRIREDSEYGGLRVRTTAGMPVSPS